MSEYNVIRQGNDAVIMTENNNCVGSMPYDMWININACIKRKTELEKALGVIKRDKIRSNGSFGILEDPKPHKQHPNQRGGLDMYVKVIRFRTGQENFVKLYENTKGLHFKAGGGTHYLDDFTRTVLYVPLQIHELEG